MVVVNLNLQEFAGLRCQVTGWGKDAFINGDYQQVLKEVDVPIVTNGQCEAMLRRTRLGGDFVLHPGFMCAGGEEGKFIVLQNIRDHNNPFFKLRWMYDSTLLTYFSIQVKTPAKEMVVDLWSVKRMVCGSLRVSSPGVLAVEKETFRECTSRCHNTKIGYKSSF